MARLILHIGVARTGSSSIQTALWRSRRLLTRHGVLYPRTGSWHGPHHDLGIAIGGSPTPPRTHVPRLQPLLRKLAREIDASTCKTVVISSDLLGSARNLDNGSAAEERLRQFLNRFEEVRIICFVRHQALQAESAYRFYVAWREQAKTDDFDTRRKPSDRLGMNDSVRGRHARHWHDYLDIERFYRSVRHDLDFQYVGFYEAQKSGLLVRTFFERAGIPDCYPGEARTNESLSRQAILAVLMWNRGLIPAGSSRDDFVEWARHAFPEQRESLYDQKLLARRVARRADGNAELAARTGIDLGMELENFRNTHALCGSELTPEFQEQVLARFHSRAITWKALIRKYIPFFG